MSVKVSVVVPIYGVEKYLRQCLDSLSAQSLKDIEFILVDDGSKDGCPAIVDEYAARDGRFVAVHQPNGGYGKAVNHGFDLAKGDYVGIVEPDDWVEPGMYHDLYERAVKVDADVVKSGFISFDNDTGMEKVKQFVVDEDVCTIEKGVPLMDDHPSIWTAIYRRAFLTKNGIRVQETKGAAWQDNLFMVQTLLLAQRLSSLPETYYHYRVFNSHLKKYSIPLECSRAISEWISTRGSLSFGVRRSLAVRFLSYYLIAIDAMTWRDVCADGKLLDRQFGYIDASVFESDKTSRFLKSLYKSVQHCPKAIWIKRHYGPRVILKRLLGNKVVALYRRIRYR